MKRNFDAPMIDPTGAPYADGATLRTVAFMALQAAGNLPGDEKMSIEEKMSIYKLTNLVAHGGVVEISIPELDLLKQRMGKALVPMVMGKAFEMLEQDYTEV